MCGKSYNQVLEETVADYLHRSAEPGEIIRQRHKKRRAFLAGLPCSAVKFIHQGVSQAAFCDGIIYSINNGNVTQEPQGNLLFLFKD